MTASSHHSALAGVTNSSARNKIRRTTGELPMSPTRAQRRQRTGGFDTNCAIHSTR
jgi:hypothetical protein